MNDIKVSEQTFRDLTTWIINPNEHSVAQFKRLTHEDERLPLMSLVNQYWLVGRLATSLKQSDVWQQLPEQLKNYLIDVDGFYESRNQMIKAEVEEVCTLLSDANIDALLMKGAATLFNGVSQPFSTRYMKDVDILIPEHKYLQAYELLLQAGYVKDSDDFDYKDSHHAPPLLKSNVCYIELHRWVLEKYLHKVLETKKVWANTKPLIISNQLAVKQLDATDQVILSITHSEIQNGGFDQCHIDLHQQMGLQSIVAHYGDEIDWEMVWQHFEKSGQQIILQSALYNAYQLVGINTPVTDLNDECVQLQFNKCIARYVKRQGEENLYSVMMDQLYLYKKRNVQLRYGDIGRLWYIKGVYKQIESHLRKIFNKHHLKLFISRFM